MAFRSGISYSFLKNYIFSALEKIVVVATTCAQTIAKNMVSIISKILEPLSSYLNNHRDFNTHVWLSLCFGLENINSTTKSSISPLT